MNQLRESLEVLESLRQRKEDDHESDHFAHAKFYQSKVLPAMNDVRAVADELEMIVDDSLWPLPKFREMLYIY